MIAIILTLLACGGEPATSEPTALTPENLAAIAEEIEASPGEAEAVLDKHGTTREAFEAALFDVASDPAKTDAYLAGRE